MPTLKRLHNPRLGEGNPTLFEAAIPVANSEEIVAKSIGIVRRLGSPPSHLNCDCSYSWLKVMTPVIDRSSNESDRHREGALGFAYLSVKTVATSANKKWQEQIRSLDDSGGIADYELLVAGDRRSTAQSMHWVMWQSGMRFTKNPFGPESIATQEPIPGLESPPLPLPQDQQRRPDWMSVGGPVT